MYSKIFESKRISIRNYHMKLLLERFDYNKFELVIDSDYPFEQMMRSKVPCALCESFKPNYESDCGECPLVIFETMDFVGCNVVIEALLPGQTLLRTCRNSVIYTVEKKKEALEDLKVIVAFLKSFKKE